VTPPHAAPRSRPNGQAQAAAAARVAATTPCLKGHVQSSSLTPCPNAQAQRSPRCAAPALLLLLALVAHDAAPQLANRADTIVALLILILLWAATLYTLLVQGGLTWTLARWFAVPLGLPITAYHLGRHAARWRHDPHGGGALMAVLALHRRPEREPAVADRLQTWLAANPLKTAGLVANGLRYALHGERDLARDLLQAALAAEADRPPTLAATYAADWLCADAAARGAWDELIDLGARPIATSRGAAFLIAVARRLLGRGAPSPTDAGLRLAWWLAPRHTLTRPLLLRALAQPRVLHRSSAPPPPPPPPPPHEAPPLPQDPLPRALALHARVLLAAPLALRLQPARLGDACRAWDDLHRSGQIHQLTAERALHLGVSARAEAVQDAFFGEIAADLAAISERAALPLPQALAAADPADPTPGAITERAIAQLRSRLLTELEAAIDALDACAVRPELPALDAWREWERLRQIHHRAAALAGTALRQLVFPGLHRSACNFAVWLWNDRKEHAIAAPIFRWLLAEAEHVGDEAAITLQRKNVGVKAT
jgi:hypothetical protein